MEDSKNNFSYETQFISFINVCDQMKDTDDVSKLKDQTVERKNLEKAHNSKNSEVNGIASIKSEEKDNVLRNLLESEVKEEIEVKVELSDFYEYESRETKIKDEKDVLKEKKYKTSKDVQKTFHCEQCNKGYTLKKHLNEHVRSVHERVKNYACGFCEKKFFKKYEKAIHERKHTGEKPYQCQICGDSFKKKLTMDEHMSNHTGIQEFHCDDCGKNFGLQRSLRHHRLLRHTHQLPCHMCEKKFSTKSHLERHLKGHLGIKDAQCVECGKQFSSDRSCRQHILNEHSEERLIAKEVFTCPECGKEFKYANNMRTHMKIHAEGHVKVQCQECGKYYKTARVLKDHIRIIHEGNSRFKCDVCGKAFGRATALEVHKTTHLKPYQCQICSQGYKTQSYLVKHMEQEHASFQSR